MNRKITPLPDKDITDTIGIGHIIESYISRGDGLAQDYDKLNVNEQIANIEPKLWNAIWCMTRSKSEIRGTSKVDNLTSPVHNVNKIRCFFLLCVIMFITDVRCSMPMHTLMTDLVSANQNTKPSRCVFKCWVISYRKNEVFSVSMPAWSTKLNIHDCLI